MDDQLFLKTSRLINRNEAESVFRPNRLYATSFSGGAGTYFRTGTALTAELTHTASDIAFQTIPGYNYFETKGVFTLSQNLWKDSFGSMTRTGLEIGSLLREAAWLGFEDSAEQWLLDLIDLYYRAWLAQVQAQAADQNVFRRERLHHITLIKAKRGTAEKPDILQTQSALTDAQVKQMEKDQSLQEIWRYLVTTLNFPNEWLSIDPKQIPMISGDFTQPAFEACKKTPNETTTTKKLALQAQAAELNVQKSKNATAPDLKFNLALATNGIDTTSSPTWSEALRNDHPSWSVGLNLTVPLSGYIEKAEIHRSISDFEKTDALSNQAKSMLQADWLNACSALEQLARMKEKLQTVLKNQLTRVELEEERFKIGRVPTIAVIQAGDDATLAELNLHGTEMHLQLSAWKIQKLTGELDPYFKAFNSHTRNP